jgi:hypothetical protein
MHRIVIAVAKAESSAAGPAELKPAARKARKNPPEGSDAAQASRDHAPAAKQ